MSTKIKALVCLFLIGFLVGACGRKFRALDENRAIEARAVRLANLHFDSLFNSDQKYQSHLNLKNELLGMDFHADSQSSRMGVRIQERDCISKEAGIVDYTNNMVLQSVAGTPIPIQGQVNYGFYAVCIPTATKNHQNQCAHFLIAVSKQYAQGDVGAALAVVGIDRQTGAWRNLEMSSNFPYSVNLRTLSQIESSFACRSVEAQNVPGQNTGIDPVTGLPTPTNQGPVDDPLFPGPGDQLGDFDPPVTNQPLLPQLDNPNDQTVNPFGPLVPIEDDDAYWFN